MNRVRKVILPLPLVFWKQGLGLKGYRNYHCPTSTIHCSYNQTLHTYQSTVVYACNLNMLPLATQLNCLKNTTKQLSKTNQLTDQKPTSETKEKTNKNPWMWKGLVQQRRWWQGREGRVNGALQTCMKFHQIPKNKSNQKAHQTGKPINRNNNNYKNLSSSYVCVPSPLFLFYDTILE